MRLPRPQHQLLPCGQRGGRGGWQWTVWAPTSGHAPFQPGKPSIVAVKRDPLAAPFDRKRGEPGICYPRPARFRVSSTVRRKIPK